MLTLQVLVFYIYMLVFIRASPSEFVIPLSKYFKAVVHTRVSVGMRLRMLFETEESSVRRYMGTITGIGDLDPVRWPNSHWRSVKLPINMKGGNGKVAYIDSYQQKLAQM